MQTLPTRLFLIGVCSLIVTIIAFWVIAPPIIHWQVSKFMTLDEGCLILNEWTTIGATIFFKVYLYNVTNPEEISAGGDPKLQEIGPYVYQEYRTNKILEMHPDNNTLKYEPQIVFYFRPELSNGTEEDVITMLNSPLVGIANELGGYSKIFRFMAKRYIATYDEKLFIQRSVKLALFGGVHSEMLESISVLLGREDLPNNTFGYFYDRNKTMEPMEIISGVQDGRNLAQILSYKGKPKLDIWDGDTCNMINGSDATLYPPFVKKDTTLQMFQGELCRSFAFRYDGEEVYDGVLGYRFKLPENFWNLHAPENHCFCTEKDKSKCPENGVLHMAPCRKGQPIMLSAPHFFNGSSKYWKEAGLSEPKKELHDSAVVVDPVTGLVLKTSLKLQINLQMKPSKDIPELRNVKEMVFPLFWLDDDTNQGKAQCDMLKNKAMIPIAAQEICKWIFFALSLVLTAAGIVVSLLRSRSKKHIDYY